MPIPTPWFVGGATHQAEIARILSYAAFKGQFGVLEELDCIAKETSTPGTSIRVTPGTFNIPTIGAGSDDQSYVGSIFSDEIVPVSPTGPGVTRSDLIVIRVEDPNIAGGGWIPPDPVNGPFAYVRVIPGVPSDTNHVSQVRPTDSAITIARLDIPENTATFTDSMFTDLRSIANLDGERLVVPGNPNPPVANEIFSVSTHCTAGDDLTTADTSFIDFPVQANYQVPIPSWATSYVAMGTFNPATATHAWAELRLVVDGLASTPVMVDENRAPDTLGNVYQPVLALGGEHAILPSSRGKVVTVKAQMRSLGGANLNTKQGVHFTMFMHFKRNPVLV